MPYEIDAKTKHNLLAMCGLPDYDDKGNENAVPPAVAALYVRTIKRFNRLSGSLLPDPVLAVIVSLAELLEEARGGESVPVSTKADDREDTIVDKWLRKEVKRGDVVKLRWKGQDHDALILGIKADRTQVKIQIDGDDTARWVDPSWVSLPEPVAA